MKRRYAVAAAKWLGKRENRAKAKGWARELKTRVKHELENHDDYTQARQDETEREKHHEQRPRPDDRGQSQR